MKIVGRAFITLRDGERQAAHIMTGTMRSEYAMGPSLEETKMWPVCPVDIKLHMVTLQQLTS